MTTSVRDLIRSLPLKEMDGTLLSAEIRSRAQVLYGALPLSLIDESAIARIDYAIDLAAYLHRTQRRRNRGDLPKDPYVNHPLRNALRLMRYGVSDADIIIAAILHDTLEDCEAELARMAGYSEGDSIDPYHYALAYLQSKFGVAVTELVEAVSNPPYPASMTKAEKRAEYIQRVTEEIKDPRVWLVKFSDWVDNAAGLYHNVGGTGMVQHLTAKYLPLADEFQRTFTSHVHVFISPQGFEAINTHIDQGRKSLTQLAKEA